MAVILSVGSLVVNLIGELILAPKISDTLSSFVHKITSSGESGKSLVSAIDDSDWKIQDRLIAGCKIDGEDGQVNPIVHACIKQTSRVDKILTIILKYRPSMNIECPVHHITPFKAALRAGANPSHLTTMIELGARPTYDDYDKISITESPDLAKSVIDIGGGIPLFIASIRMGSRTMLAHLLREGITKIGISELSILPGDNKFGLVNLPLTYAISCGSKKVIKLLLDVRFTLDRNVLKSQKLDNNLKAFIMVCRDCKTL